MGRSLRHFTISGPRALPNQDHLVRWSGCWLFSCLEVFLRLLALKVAHACWSSKTSPCSDWRRSTCSLHLGHLVFGNVMLLSWRLFRDFLCWSVLVHLLYGLLEYVFYSYWVIIVAVTSFLVVILSLKLFKERYGRQIEWNYLMNIWCSIWWSSLLLWQTFLSQVWPILKYLYVHVVDVRTPLNIYHKKIIIFIRSF